MNYTGLESIIREGINFMSDDSGIYTMQMSQGSVEIIDGVEVPVSGEVAIVKGLVREIKARDIDGEFIQAGDKRGIFTAAIPIKQGYRIDVDGEAYIVVDPRPVKPTNTVVAYRPILRRIATYGG